jgi:2-oxoglutarate dehydrogenase E1 component
MNDVVGMIEREAGPSWARPDWPLAELDELNLGLDPTQATIEKLQAAVADRAAQTSASAWRTRARCQSSRRTSSS